MIYCQVYFDWTYHQHYLPLTTSVADPGRYYTDPIDGKKNDLDPDPSDEKTDPDSDPDEILHIER